MSKRYAKRITLTHGIVVQPPAPGRQVFSGVAEFIKPFEHELIMPYNDINKVTIDVATVGDVLKSHAAAREIANPGTTAYNHAMAREQLRRRAHEDIDDDFFNSIAGRDYDELTSIIYYGATQPGGKNVFTLDRSKLPESYTQHVWLRLHNNNDRDNAEANLRGGDRNEDPLAYQVQLLHLLLTLDGQKPDWNTRPDVHCLHALTYQDFNLLLGEVFARDYEPLAKLLAELVVEVDGEAQPFPVVSEGADSEGAEEGAE